MANSYDPVYDYKNNPHYIKFNEQKEEIKKKYPPQIFTKPASGSNTLKEYKKYLVNGDRELHLQYLKELADLIFQTDGEFQELTWDMIGQVQQIEMERRARGRKLSRDYLGE